MWLPKTVLVTKILVSNADIFLGFLGFVLLFFFSLLQQANRGEKQMPAPFFSWLPRHKQDAGSYKDSIIKKSTENN